MSNIISDKIENEFINWKIYKKRYVENALNKDETGNTKIISNWLLKIKNKPISKTKINDFYKMEFLIL